MVARRCGSGGAISVQCATSRFRASARDVQCGSLPCECNEPQVHSDVVQDGLRSLDIDRRIDYVFVTSRKKDGRGTVHDCRVVLADREDGICASDHYGVFADVQVVIS